MTVVSAGAEEHSRREWGVQAAALNQNRRKIPAINPPFPAAEQNPGENKLVFFVLYCPLISSAQQPTLLELSSFKMAQFCSNF